MRPGSSYMLVVLLCGAGCTESRPATGGPPDARVVRRDGGESSTGGPDAALRLPDAGTSDAGALDAGSPDAGTSDAGAPDAGVSDAGSGRIDCEGEDAVAAPVIAPVEGAFEAARVSIREAVGPTAFSLELDPAACPLMAYDEALPLGSAFVYARPTPEGDCEVWLGGEHESPQYDGSPTQYCRFEPSCLPLTLWIDGDPPLCGPAGIDSNRCVY